MRAMLATGLRLTGRDADGPFEDSGLSCRAGPRYAYQPRPIRTLMAHVWRLGELRGVDPHREAESRNRAVRHYGASGRIKEIGAIRH